MICGIRFMELRNLIDAVIVGDLLTARQWVADARRKHLNWEGLAYPKEFGGTAMIVAAALVERLASRAGANPPAWTADVGADDPLVLDPGLEDMPRSFAKAKTAGPEPLRKRNLFALPDFLDVA